MCQHNSKCFSCINSGALSNKLMSPIAPLSPPQTAMQTLGHWQLAGGHKARKSWNWNLNTKSLTPKSDLHIIWHIKAGFLTIFRKQAKNYSLRQESIQNENHCVKIKHVYYFQTTFFKKSAFICSVSDLTVHNNEREMGVSPCYHILLWP